MSAPPKLEVWPLTKLIPIQGWRTAVALDRGTGNAGLVISFKLTDGSNIDYVLPPVSALDMAAKIAEKVQLLNSGHFDPQKQ